MAQLNDISNRKTPSVPLEITYAAGPVAPGRKITTIFAHLAASGSVALPYSTYGVTNLGDPVAARAEVDALAGAGSEAGHMAFAFVQANSAVGGPNYPAFRLCFLAFGDTGFGTANVALTAVQNLRSDLFVSCYGAGLSTQRSVLLALCAQLSGPDRDLLGQYGSFAVFASVAPLATQEAYAINSLYALVASLPDSNTALVNINGTVTTGSNVITAPSSLVGVYPGAVLSGTGIPSATVINQISGGTILMSQNATASGSAEAIAVQNELSQSEPVLAAAYSGRMMSFGLPYIPLQGVTIGGLAPPQIQSDWIQVNPNGASEAALVAGLSPLYVQPGGTVGLLRTVTTLTVKPDAVTPVTAYFDWQDVVVLYDFREAVYAISQNPPFNGNPGGTKATAAIAAKFKDEVIREALSFEDAGAFQGVKANAPLFLVQPSTTSRGRFDFYIPINVVPGLIVMAGQIQGVSDLGNFQL